jgi:hypothetical protein
LIAPLVPFLSIFDQAQQVLAGACVVVFQVLLKISMSFACDSSQQRHNGGPQKHILIERHEIADRTDRAILHLITHGGLVAALPPVVLCYRFFKRLLKFGRQLVPPHALPHWIESRAPTFSFSHRFLGVLIANHFAQEGRSSMIGPVSAERLDEIRSGSIGNS